MWHIDLEKTLVTAGVFSLYGVLPAALPRRLTKTPSEPLVGSGLSTAHHMFVHISFYIERRRVLSVQSTFYKKHAPLSGKLDEPERVIVSANTPARDRCKGGDFIKPTKEILGGRGGGFPRGETIQGRGKALSRRLLNASPMHLPHFTNQKKTKPTHR
jgi:hypothetical protein